MKFYDLAVNLPETNEFYQVVNLDRQMKTPNALAQF
jgi:hypothetical protein